MTNTSSHASAPRHVRAIVTGHTRGLGSALAAQLLQRNIDVLGVSRSRHPIPGALAGEPASGRFVETELDLADTARLEAWLRGDALARFVEGADLVLLFNNAGVVEPIGPLDTQDVASVARAVSLNVAAPLMLASALASIACVAGSTMACRIVHVSSGAARNAYAGWSVYCATKAALDHHARAVAMDANAALRICSLAPGVVDTGMQAAIRASSAERFPMIERFEQLKASGALATPDAAAAKLIDYALSDAFGSAPTADVRDLPAA